MKQTDMITGVVRHRRRRVGIRREVQISISD